MDHKAIWKVKWFGNFFTISIQVSSATATFAMTFSSSMSVVEYYLLKRFPVSYGKCPQHPYNLSFIYSYQSKDTL